MFGRSLFVLLSFFVWQLWSLRVWRSLPWTWLTVSWYLYHKWPRICSVRRNHNPVLTSSMTYHYRVSNKSNTTSVTSGAGTAYPSGAPEFSVVFFSCSSRVRVVHVKLHVFTFLVSFCDVRCDSRVKTMFASFLLPFVLKEFMFYLCYLYSCTYTGVQHDFHIRWCSWRLTATLRISPVELVVSLPEHLRSPSVFSGIRVAQSLVFCVMFVDHCFPFPFAHCIACSVIYCCWWPLSILQTFLIHIFEWLIVV